MPDSKQIVWADLGPRRSGPRGCCGTTTRRGVPRCCGQSAVAQDADGNGWCYYHDPAAPRKFGEGHTGEAKS